MFKKKDQQLLAEAYGEVTGTTSYSDDPNAITGREAYDNYDNYQARDKSLLTFRNIQNVLKNNNASLVPIDHQYDPSGRYIIKKLGIESEIPEGYAAHVLVKGTKGKLPITVLGTDLKFDKYEGLIVFIMPENEEEIGKKEMYWIDKAGTSSPFTWGVKSIKDIYKAVDRLNSPSVGFFDFRSKTAPQRHDDKNEAKYKRDNVLGGPSFNPSAKS